MQVLRGSPMIGNLAMLVVSYGVSHRLFDFAWKGQLRSVYPSAHEYQVRLQGALPAAAADREHDPGRAVETAPVPAWKAPESVQPCMTGCCRLAAGMACPSTCWGCCRCIEPVSGWGLLF